MTTTYLFYKNTDMLMFAEMHEVQYHRIGELINWLIYFMRVSLIVFGNLILKSL